MSKPISEVDNTKATKICYYCGCDITDENKSLEHILQNALGGKIKSNYILCATHNDLLNVEIDKEFVKKFEIITEGLKIKKERKSKSNSTLIKNPFTDKKLRFNQSKVKPTKPEYDVEENIIYASDNKTGNQFKKKIIKDHNPKNDPTIKTEKYEVNQNYAGLTLEFSIDVDDPVICKGLAKIAAGFATLNGIRREDMPELIDLSSLGIREDIIIAENTYADIFMGESISDLNVYPLHTLQLITNKRQLICRIDLFSAFSFDILLNKDFDRNIDIDYIFSVRERTQIPVNDFICFFGTEEDNFSKYYNKRLCSMDIEQKIEFSHLNSETIKSTKEDRVKELKNTIFFNIAEKYLETDKSQIVCIRLDKIFPQEFLDEIKANIRKEEMEKSNKIN